MDFGARWACVDQVRYADGEALVSLSLAPHHWNDLASWPWHPALLDMALGAAQALLPSDDLRRDFFVPQAYRSVRILAPLTPVLVSHVRLVSATGDHVEFDVDIADEEGRTLVAIDGFRLRRMDDAVLVALRDAARVPAQILPAAFIAGVADGIAPAEAAPLLMRLVTQVGAGAVLVSPTPVDALRRAREPRDAASAAVTPPTARARPLDGEPAAPRGSRETQLARLWQEALGIVTVGVHDDFFALGGHSLLLTRLASRARRQVGVTLPLSALFETPTIAGWLGPAATAREGPVADWTTVATVAREAFIAPDAAR